MRDLRSTFLLYFRGRNFLLGLPHQMKSFQDWEGLGRVLREGLAIELEVTLKAILPSRVRIKYDE